MAAGPAGELGQLSGEGAGRKLTLPAEKGDSGPAGDPPWAGKGAGPGIAAPGQRAHLKT